MTPELAKSIVGLLVPIMSFLGWSTPEYIDLLPKNIQQEIITSEKKVEAIPPIETTKVTENKSDTKSKSGTKTTVVLPSKKQPTYYPEPVTQTKKTTQKPTTPKINSVVTTAPIIKTQKPIGATTTTPTETKPKTESIVVKPKTNLSTEEKIRQSTVNILCSRIIGNAIQKTTGSGVVIDPSGIIITNAHVAEYFLLAQSGNNTSCYIRTGSPAINSYKAKLIYLPSIWIERNKNNLSMQTITGTGENDYALLAITERISASAPDAPLVYLNPSSDNLVKNQKIFIAGYPAGFSDVRILDSALYSLIKSSEVTNIAGFDGRSTDVINTSPTSVAEHGSSGGVVADEDGNLRALIVATTIDNYSGGKNIQAITLPYIKKSIQNNSGKSFNYFLENAREEINIFEKNSVNNLAGILLGN